MFCDIVLVSMYVKNFGDHSMVHCGINSHTNWNLLSDCDALPACSTQFV
jgi:hypothetical protein